MANELVAFKGASLAKMDLDILKKGLDQAQDRIQVGSGVSFLKMLKANGEWVYGAQDMDVEPGSEWAVNPMSMEIGFIAWGDRGGAPLGKQMRSIFQPVLRLEDLPNVGAEWDDNVAFQLQCMTGEDTGVVVEYTQNSYGAKAAFQELVKSIRLQIEKDPANLVPVIVLESDSYKHKQYGTIHNPLFKIVKWIGMGGAAEQSAEPSPKVQDQTAQRQEPTKQTAAEPEPQPETTRTRRFNRTADTTAQEGTGASPPAGEKAQPNVVRRTRRRS